MMPDIGGGVYPHLVRPLHRDVYDDVEGARRSAGLADFRERHYRRPGRGRWPESTLARAGVGMMSAADPTKTLAELRPGMNATVTSFVEEDENVLRKILSLGIVPGDDLLVLSTWPAVVFELGSTSYALDIEIAKGICVTSTPR